MITDICEKDFGMKRHQLGIFTDERSQFVYRGESQSVGYYDIDSLIKKGTDIILAEKAYVVKLLAPLAESYGIALLESGGNFVEYARKMAVHQEHLTVEEVSHIIQVQVIHVSSI